MTLVGTLSSRGLRGMTRNEKGEGGRGGGGHPLLSLSLLVTQIHPNLFTKKKIANGEKERSYKFQTKPKYYLVILSFGLSYYSYSDP